MTPNERLELARHAHAALCLAWVVVGVVMLACVVYFVSLWQEAMALAGRLAARRRGEFR